MAETLPCVGSSLQTVVELLTSTCLYYTKQDPPLLHHQHLVYPKHPRPPPLPRLLPLIPLLKRTGFLVTAAKVIEVLDLINPNDPVLRRKRLLDGAKLRALRRETTPTYTVLSLTGREKAVVVVVRHLVHEGVLHGRGGFVVDAVFAALGEEVAFFYFVGPDT